MSRWDRRPEPKPAKQPGEDPFDGVRILFLRLYDRQQSERVEFGTEQVEGIGWRVTVRLGAPREQPTRARLPVAEGFLVDPPYTARATPVVWRKAEAPSVDEAVLKLRKELAREIELRVKSDLGALTLAGEPMDLDPGDGVPRVIDVPGEEVPSGRRALPERGGAV